MKWKYKSLNKRLKTARKYTDRAYSTCKCALSLAEANHSYLSLLEVDIKENIKLHQVLLNEVHEEMKRNGKVIKELDKLL